MKLLAILLLASSCLFSQTIEDKEFNFTAGINPYIFTPNLVNELNSLNITEDATIYQNKQNTSEIYFLTTYNTLSCWNISVGISYSKLTYNYSNFIRLNKAGGGQTPPNHYFARMSNSFRHKNELQLNLIGLKLQTSYSINEKNSISFGLDFSKIINYSFQNELLGISNDANITITEIEGGFISDKSILLIPEVFGETKLYKNLSLTYGAKLRFWGREKTFYELSYKNYDFMLLDYKLSSRQLGFFIGLNYQFNK